MATASHLLPRAAVLACAAALAACASTDYHYSQISGYRWYRSPIDTYPVTILRVDGQDTILRPVPVDAGLRKITVQGPPGGAGPIVLREIELNVAPCTRYYLVAVKPNKLASDFTVRVDYQEPVGGCSPPTS